MLESEDYTVLKSQQMKLFDKSGVFFKYQGDVLKWKWPWARKLHGYPYHSFVLNRDFNSFREYWAMQGADGAMIKLSGGSGRIHGFDLVEDVLPRWSARLWPNEYLVCLTNVNPKAKGPKFWAMIDQAKRTELLQDVVILCCKDKTEMENLLNSIDRSFAVAFGMLNGEIIGETSMGPCLP